MHVDFHTITVAIGGLSAVAQHVVGPLLPLGTAYYFWVLGGHARDEANKKKDKVKIQNYRKIFTQVQTILKDNAENHQTLKSDLKELLELDITGEEEILGTWK